MAIIKKRWRIRDGDVNSEFLELEIFECKKVDASHIMWQLNARERRIRDPVSVKKRIT